MKTIQSKIGQVIRRVFLQSLVNRLPWFLFALLMMAVVAIAVPKLVYWPWLVEGGHQQVWTLSWGWGTAAAAMLLSLWSCWWSRLSAREAAEQLDQRFQLHQRASSALTMAKGKSDPGFYQALVQDAEKRVVDLVVSEQFPIRSRWPMLLPILPLLALLGLSLVPAMAAPENLADVTKLEETEKEQLAELIKKASNRSEDNREVDKEMEATRIVQQAMERAEKDLAKKDLTRKEAMVAINDVKKAIEDQQKKLGQANSLKDRLEQLKEQTQGPADKMSDAMKEGKFGEAEKQLAKLAEKIAKGELSKEDTNNLIKQMDDMQKQLEQVKKEFENKKRDLERQIQDAAAEGDLQRAAELQEQKEQLEQQQRQMQQLEKLAQQAGKIGEAMKQAQQNGGKLNEQQMQDLQQAMKQMGQEFKEMELDAKQMEQLKEMMQKMDQMKEGMKGGKPGQFGNGDGKSDDEGGRGMGDGKGKGDRPTNDDGDGNFYDSQVKPDVKPGEVARIGKVGGPNRKGMSTAEIESSIREAAKNTDLTPDELQSIPFYQREHVRDYFKTLRDN